MKVVSCVQEELVFIVSLYGRITRGAKGGDLPYDKCQQFESTYLKLVNLADRKLYDNIKFFRFDSSIYNLSFVVVDKIIFNYKK